VQPMEDHLWGFTGIFDKNNGGGFLDEVCHGSGWCR
jgi:formamidase